jgi:hypothetical protein
MRSVERLRVLNVGESCAAQAIDYSMSHESHAVAEEKRMIARRAKIEVGCAC